MEWLNYHHLFYFWTVVRTGGITRASAELRLAPPTISAQIRSLEASLGEKLLDRSGRNLTPTDMGRVIFRYADEIFSLGRELVDTVKGRPTGRPLRLVIGVADVLPKSIVHWLIEPALQLGEPVRIVCREDNAEHLLAQLAIQELDLVLLDAPIAPTVKIRAYNHLLGECGVTFVATPELAATYRRRFPQSLHGAPLLLPTENTAIRRSLEQWFDSQAIRPEVVGEFEDYALLREFGRTGTGVFPAPTVVEKHLRRQYGLQRVGRTEAVRGRFYAISVEKKLKHPAVVAICETARRRLLA
jgi:LysR family transcriptional activator of nhaA